MSDLPPERFRNRAEAGVLLAAELRTIPLRDSLVLAIPRGGLEVAAPLARDLDAELDVVLSRKLRAPRQPELALGAVAESGDVHLESHAFSIVEPGSPYLEQELRTQRAEIERRKMRFRAVRPQASVAGRSVIVTDDGVATGATLIAALKTVRAQGPHEIIVAVPVGPPDRLEEVSRLCDRTVVLSAPPDFAAVGQFYEDFREVTEEHALHLLDQATRRRAGRAAKPPPTPRGSRSA